MTSPLQAKDKQWRSRPNAAVPVADVGLSPLGTDEEAGGARAEPAASSHTPATPLPTRMEQGGHGLRLTPGVWYSMAGVAVLVLIVAGLASI